MDICPQNLTSSRVFLQAQYILDGSRVDTKENDLLKRGLRVTAGLVLVVLGLLGLALPIMPGWVFVIPGLMILGREFHWARRLLDWLKHRVPRKSPES